MLAMLRDYRLLFSAARASMISMNQLNVLIFINDISSFCRFCASPTNFLSLIEDEWSIMWFDRPSLFSEVQVVSASIRDANCVWFKSFESFMTSSWRVLFGREV